MKIDGKKEERKALKKIGAEPTPASGAMWHSKADGKIQDYDRPWRVETKSTGKDSYTVTRAVLERLEKDSLDSGGTPMLQINFVKHERIVLAVPQWCLPNEFIDECDDPGTNKVWPYSRREYLKARGQHRYVTLSLEMGKNLLGLQGP